MAIEAKNFRGLPEHANTLIFLAEISQPLNLWQQTVQNLHELNNQYLGEKSIAENISQRTVQFWIDYLKNKGRTVTASLQRRALRVTIDHTIKVISAVDGEQATKGKLGILTGLTNRMGPDEKRTFQELLDETHSHQLTYQSELKKINAAKQDSKTTVRKQLSTWLAADFDHLPQLAVLTEQETDKLGGFLQFLSENSDILDTTTQSTRNQEVENPSPQRITAFFDQWAENYYRQNKKDPLWESIEFFLPISSEEIQSLYQNGTGQIERSILLFEPITQRLQQGKKLPQAISQLYATYLSKIQRGAISALQQKISLLKMKSLPHTSTPIQTVSELIPPDQETQQTPPPVQKSELPSPAEKPQPPKIVIIGSQLCSDEIAIKETLKDFLTGRIKGISRHHIDTYTMVLAKLAGIRQNAPNHNLKKIGGVSPIQLSDGLNEPILRLRLNNNDAPRLFMIFHDQFLIVFEAINRDDHTYAELVRKGGSSQINLPS